MLKDGAKNKTVAKKYGISESQVSALRTEIESAIDKLNGLDTLVLTPKPDKAIAIDETFLKIESSSIYVIIATGYTFHKTLGIKLSKDRSERDIREVFDEAEGNQNIILVSIHLRKVLHMEKMKNLSKHTFIAPRGHFIYHKLL